MIKKLQIISLIMLVLVLLIVSCAPQPTAPAAEKPGEKIITQEGVPVAEPVVDEVAADISDSVDMDEELDTSELDDVDDILAEIENI